MTDLREISFQATDMDALPEAEGRIAVLIPEDGTLSPGARRLNRLTKGAVARALDSEAWSKKKTGEMLSLGFPAGLAADGVDLVRLSRRPSVEEARKAGAAIAKAAGTKGVILLAESTKNAHEIALGLALRSYSFTTYKSEKNGALAPAVVHVSKPDEAEAAFASCRAVAEAVVFTRDLVNEPANVLSTTEFADRLVALERVGLEVEVIDEDEMERLGMGALLAVARGSETPAKLVVMKWMKGGDEPPLALVGKGVVFDTGGISIKPGAGMESMTMDMGGAGTVAGTMMALAGRGAKANVIGLVGLVENMPDGRAYRPGDVLTSMKGDTIEVINTDAEGRLVLADVLWYAQETYKPAGIVDLATLTGACIIALGNDNAAYYATDEAFGQAFGKAAKAEGEGAWQMPLGKSYADLMKSDIADVKNAGGRAAGSITAAEFLHRFVKDGIPWIHIDIAGVAHVPSEQTLSPKGATGWGVMALNRFVRDRYET
ncbi:aminopeptidase A [Roseivivax halodurans JCM 10272]|uniref:Probable cytosol aminopeptidase n=1 Tax=Roseivivax halodurans JCM 10272 TaxID=1449350 RepID=X7EFK2_9RHOB|nr:leucyl aminopeptidase [Roseivivax halodurans]ETX14660.1 aminopeptidase A [Roseivivax halodurans JCM 10272]